MEELENLYEQRVRCINEINHLENNIINYKNSYAQESILWLPAGLIVGGVPGAVLGAITYGVSTLVQNIILNSTFNEAVYGFVSLNGGTISLVSSAVIFGAATAGSTLFSFKLSQDEKAKLKAEIKNCEERIVNEQKEKKLINKKIKKLQPNKSANAIPPKAKEKMRVRMRQELIKTQDKINDIQREIRNCDKAIADKSYFTDLENMFPISIIPLLGIPTVSTVATWIWAHNTHNAKSGEIEAAQQDYASQVAETAQSEYGITLTPDTSTITQQMHDIKATLSGSDLYSWGAYTNEVKATLSNIPTEILGFDHWGLIFGVLVGSLAVVTTGLVGATRFAHKMRINGAIKEKSLNQRKLEDLEMQKQILEDDCQALDNGGALLNEY